MFFIQQIVADIQPKDLYTLVDKCYVFPTRRACAFFRYELQQKFKDKVFFAPQIMSIQDCAMHITNMHIADELHLLLELFKVYMPITKEVDKFDRELTFDVFYPWGQMLLKDFDEIDKYLVDAEKLYSTLFEIREMEVEFNINQEMIEVMERFRTVMSAEEKTALQENFLKIWSKSYEVYKIFKQTISQKKMAYEGMIYNHWNKLLDQSPEDTRFLYNEFVFCGFNALSKVEESIINKLLKQKKATIYWDADTTYLDNNKLEAGMFMRKYFKIYPPSATSKWILTKNEIFKNNKFDLIEVQGDVGQARLTGAILDENKFAGRNTAVIVCNENLLFPCLYGMPSHIKRLNVTMGYPVKLTPLFALIQAIFDLQLQIKGSKNKPSFQHQVIQTLFKNTFFKSLTAEGGEKLLNEIIDKKLWWIPQSVIFDCIKNKEVQALFAPSENSLLILEKLEILLFKLFENLTLTDTKLDNKVSQQETDAKATLEQEIVYYFIKHLKLFRTRIEQYEFEFEIKHLKKIFLESMMGLKIPFSGEPLEGVQFMGFLESRVIDFDNIIIAALNENNIPANSKNKSFIPFAIRIYYGLPTYIEQDAIYAYHFFRLLQRAKKAFLITDSLKGDAGEESRFYQQIKSYLRNRKVTFDYKVYTNLNAVATKVEPLVVEKNEEVMSKLQLFLNTSEKPSFSPTSLLDYIKCPIQFYLKRIAEIKPLAEFENEIQNLDFGNIIHNCLENIYNPDKINNLNKHITKELAEAVSKKELVDAEILKELKAQNFIGTNKALEGKNLMLQQLIQRLVHKVLLCDKARVPFVMMETEQNLRFDLQISNGNYVKLQGKIDRIDLANNVYTIIDYKTGAVKLDGKIDLFANTKHKEIFQASFYAYLFHKNAPAKPIKAGFYALKQISNGILYINQGKLLDKVFFDNFEEKLITLLDEIMDKNHPFEQVVDSSRYIYSDYKELVANV